MNLGIIISIIVIGEISILYEHATSKKNRWFFCLLVCLFAVCVALRDTLLVPDTVTYKNRYDYYLSNHKMSSIFFDVFGYAPLFSLISQTMGFLGIDFKYFSVVIVLINTYCVVKATRIICKSLTKGESFSICIAYMIYLGYFGIFYNAIALRAGLAMSLTFLGYAYKTDNNKRGMIISYVLSVLFHTSALFYILIDLFLQKKIIIRNDFMYGIWWLGILFVWLTRISQYLITIISFFLTLISKILPSFSRYIYYLDLYRSGGGVDIFASKKNMFFLALGLIFIIARKYCRSENFDWMLNSFFVGLSILFLFNSINDIYRVADYFLFMSIPLLYRVFNKSTLFDRKSSLIVLELIVPIQFIISLRITGIY